jgi:hypothetical protein
MTSAVNHVLLTRFNLPSAGAESFIRARENWLRQRITLFETYCVPSVLHQTVAGLKWIIYLDPQSPEWLKNRMLELSSSGLFAPIYREEVQHSELLADIRSIVCTPGERLVTTNLDNDDGLARDFAERVQAVSLGLTRRVVYVDHGLIIGSKKLYLRNDQRNAFCSVAESWDAPMTCWSAWHTELDKTMPAAHVGGGPGWLQVIHGDNVSNRIRGKRVSPLGYRASFPDLLDDLSEPSPVDCIAEKFVHGPRRGLREGARAAAKHAVLAVGGRQSLEAVHSRLSAFRSRIRLC